MAMPAIRNGTGGTAKRLEIDVIIIIIIIIIIILSIRKVKHYEAID